MNRVSRGVIAAVGGTPAGIAAAFLLASDPTSPAVPARAALAALALTVGLFVALEWREAG